MKFDPDATEFVLSSGRRFYAHAGVLGMADDMGLSYGYDGGVNEEDPFTPAERKEIADHMIGLWQTWAACS